MNWNYRVFETKDGFELREAYYENDEIIMTGNPQTISAYESVEEMIEALEMMLNDIRRSDVIDELNTIGNKDN